MTAAAVIVAAGRGERMRSETRKAFLEFAGRPLFVHSVETFTRVPRVGRIVVVVHSDDLAAARSALDSIDSAAAVVAGGATRRDSSLAGIRAAAEAEIVLIHDGCRPLVDRALIGRVLDEVERHGAAVPVLPSTDTLYRIDGVDPRVAEVLDRTSIARAQTPQGFRRATILRCLETADPAITDDVSALIAAGQPVVAVEGSPANLKITVPEDLRWAEALAER